MPLPPNRASRARRRALAVCAVTLAAACVTSVMAPAGVAKTKKPKTVININPGDVTVYKVGNEPQSIPDDVRNAVMATLTSYVNAATVKPLRKGVANDTKLASTLAPQVAARLTGPDRAVLVDEGLPKSVGRVKVVASPVALTGLADGGGNVIVVTAALDSTAKTKTKKGKVSIKRSGELVLKPENGVWKISGYTLTVDRLGKGLATPATTTPAAPTATPTTTR